MSRSATDEPRRPAAVGARRRRILAKPPRVADPVPLRRERCSDDGEPCAFCDHDTDYWTALPDRKPHEQVACCESCGARHSPREVPTKAEWCGKPHVESSPRSAYHRPAKREMPVTRVGRGVRRAADFNRAHGRGTRVQYTTEDEPRRVQGSWISAPAFSTPHGEVRVFVEHEDEALPLDRVKVLGEREGRRA